MEQSREIQPAQWEGWECLEKNPCFGMQVQLWGSQSAGDIPGITLGWQHCSLGSSAPAFDPQIQGLQSFFPLLFQAFHFRGLISPNLLLDQPPKNIPKILMDIFGLESGGMAPTLSPPWDTRGAKFPGSGSAFPQAGHISL